MRSSDAFCADGGCLELSQADAAQESGPSLGHQDPVRRRAAADYVPRPGRAACVADCARALEPPLRVLSLDALEQVAILRHVRRAPAARWTRRTRPRLRHMATHDV